MKIFSRRTVGASAINAGLYSHIKHYYQLTKPGIIRGNLITALAGFCLAAQGDIVVSRLLGMIVGLALVVAAGCVCNNYMDRGIDARMARTRSRELVVGAISGGQALGLATILGCGGVLTLVWLTSLTAAGLAVFGFIAYVLVYGAAKRRSVHGTIIGSISGAIPPVVGYSAAGGGLNGGAVILFLILVTWQMPHFYAIAMYRRADYAAAGIPVLPVRKGLLEARLQIILYCAAFIVACSGLFIYGYSGRTYLVISGLAGLIWSFQALRGLQLSGDAEITSWAKRMFGYSLLVITALCLGIVIDSFLR